MLHNADRFDLFISTFILILYSIFSKHSRYIIYKTQLSALFSYLFVVPRKLHVRDMPEISANRLTWVVCEFAADYRVGPT